MVKQIAEYIRHRMFHFKMKPGKAYDLLSPGYDDQPGNLLMALDDILMNDFLNSNSVNGKALLDVGCGTGRHWGKLLAGNPRQLTGYDVSAGMLKQLQLKFPTAEAYLLNSNELHATAAASCDLLISTLAIGYISYLQSAFGEWNRVLKPGADIFITDLHPSALLRGDKRTFSLKRGSIEIQNYIYPVEKIEELAHQQQWSVQHRKELAIDDTMKKYFENSPGIYDRMKGMLIIYSIHLKKAHAAL